LVNIESAIQPGIYKLYWWSKLLQGRKWHQGSEAYGKVWQKGDVIGSMLDMTDKTISKLNSLCLSTHLSFMLLFYLDAVLYHSSVLLNDVKVKKAKSSICIARLMYKTPLTRISSMKLSRQAVFRSSLIVCKHRPAHCAQWPNNRPHTRCIWWYLVIKVYWSVTTWSTEQLTSLWVELRW